MADLTLQINLSGGDIPYAIATVPRLVGAHRNAIKEAIGVVDCCRPQRTQMVDPDLRFPEPLFSQRVVSISQVAERLKREGVLDRIIYIYPEDSCIRSVLKRYVGWFISETHDCYGCGLVSYLYGLEEARTRYLLHYDADMLLHQADGYDWSVDGLACLSKDPGALAASPRVSPPFAAWLQQPDAPSLHKSDVFFEPADGFWRVGWFSARCFLLDLHRLKAWLPLLSLKDPAYLSQVLVRKCLQRGYPPALETLLFRRACCHGAYRVDLMTDKAFVLHPTDKGKSFLEMLPRLIESIRGGNVPLEQRGWENIKTEAWGRHLSTGKAVSDL